MSKLASRIISSPFRFDYSVIKGHTVSSYVVQKVREQLHTTGDRTWVLDHSTGREIKISEIEQSTRRLASALYRQGLRRGDVLFYQTVDTTDLFLLLLATFSANGAARGIHMLENTEGVVREMSDSKPKFVLCDPVTAPRVLPALDKFGKDVKLLCVGGNVTGATSVSELLDDDGGDCPEKDVDENEDGVLILSTSGTTGRPRGCVHTHRSLLTVLATPGMVRANSPYLNLYPNFHTGGFCSTFALLLSGCVNVTISRQSEAAIVDCIRKYKPENVCCTPFHIPMFVKSQAIQPEDLNGVKRLLSGSSHIPESVQVQLKQKFPGVRAIHKVYGLTEVVSVTTSTTMACEMDNENTIKEEDIPLSAVGKPIPCVQYKVIDVKSGEALGPNEDGELYLKSEALMKGYLNDNEGLEKQLTEDGWLKTGDIGHYDKDGWFYILGRKADLISCDKKLVSPTEIEEILIGHPGVQEVAVARTPHPEFTECAKAFVVAKPGTKVSEEDLQKLVQAKMPVHKQLHGGVVFIKHFERTQNGKVSKTYVQSLVEKYKPVQEIIIMAQD